MWQKKTDMENQKGKLGKMWEREKWENLMTTTQNRHMGQKGKMCQHGYCEKSTIQHNSTKGHMQICGNHPFIHR